MALPISQKECDDLIKKSRNLFNNGKYIDFVDMCQLILEFKTQTKHNSNDDSDEYKYYANISHAYYMLRDFSNALKSAKECIKAKPQWYKGHYRAAKACEGMLNAEEAREHYTNMIASAHPDKPKEINDSYNVDVNIMREWLLNNGASLGNTKIEYYDVDYRGMCVDKHIKVGENIMKIPIKCIMSLEESKTRGINKQLLSMGATYNSPHTYLALDLLDAKYDPESTYKYCIACLPKYFNNVPINFNKKKLQNLEGSFALVKIAQKIQFLKAEYQAICALMSNFKYTYEDFVWARTCIITRVYAVDRIINKVPVKDTVLVPFADMANHVMVPNTHWFFDQSYDSFVVNAAKYLHAGDNLFESYGKKNNYRYFVNYGFTVENNTEEEVAIVLNPILQSIIAEKTYFDNPHILNFINSSHEIFQIGYNKNSDQFKLMMKCAERKCAELLSLSPGQKPAPEYIYDFVAGFMRRTLDRFDTSLEEDVQMLKSYDMGFDVRNCLIQRMGEKKLLQHYIGYFGDLALLEKISDQKDKKKFIKKMEKKYKQPL